MRTKFLMICKCISFFLFLSVATSWETLEFIPSQFRTYEFLLTLLFLILITKWAIKVSTEIDRKKKEIEWRAEVDQWAEEAKNNVKILSENLTNMDDDALRNWLSREVKMPNENIERIITGRRKED